MPKPCDMIEDIRKVGGRPVHDCHKVGCESYSLCETVL